MSRELDLLNEYSELPENQSIMVRVYGPQVQNYQSKHFPSGIMKALTFCHPNKGKIAS